MAERIAAEMRFFHRELEFPDVFREAGSGFDAILVKPNMSGSIGVVSDIPRSPSAERWLRVAEDRADYRANTPPEGRQPDLFE